MTRIGRRASPGCAQHFDNWGGSTAATCDLMFAGRSPIPIAHAPLRGNWCASARRPFRVPSLAVAAMQRETRTMPIVAIQAGDLVTAGFAQSHARPGGNVTGFVLFEATLNTKFLQLLKDIAPQTNRVGVMQSLSSAWRGDFAAIEAVAASFRVQVTHTLVRDAADIERAFEIFAREPNGGLILPPDNTTIRHRELIIALAARHRLPSVYSDPVFVAPGGLMFYGADFADVFRRAASYVDRILRGERRAISPCRPQLSSGWCSTSRPPRPSASTCRRRFSPAPTR